MISGFFCHCVFKRTCNTIERVEFASKKAVIEDGGL